MSESEATARSDSEQARFVSLLESHRKIVFKIVAAYGWNAEDRRDLEQEIVVELWRSFGRFDEKRSFSTWMYRVALNVAISFARRTETRDRRSAAAEEPEVDRLAAEPSPEPDERVRALQRFIAGLDEMNRALCLLYLEDRSSREIAEVLGITETNVTTKIHRLKQRIRKELAAVPAD